jgi:hypothetical protein
LWGIRGRLCVPPVSTDFSPAVKILPRAYAVYCSIGLSHGSVSKVHGSAYRRVEALRRRPPTDPDAYLSDMEIFFDEYTDAVVNWRSRHRGYHQAITSLARFHVPSGALVFWTGYVLQESLFIPLLVLTFYLLLRVVQHEGHDGVCRWALTGAAMGVLLLTRPTSAPFLALVPLWIAWSRWRCGASRLRLLLTMLWLFVEVSG